MGTNLTEVLSRIPRPKLCEFIGNNVVAALDEMNLLKLNTDYSKVLIDLHGSDLFLIKGLLSSIAYKLFPTEIEAIVDGIESKESKLETIASLKWGKNDLSRRLCDLLSLDLEQFLPKITENLADDSEIIEPLIDVEKMYNSGDRHFKMFPLHPYQKTIKDEIVKLLFRPGCQFLVHMPTGSGKTKTAVESIVDFWRSKGDDTGIIVWLAHTRELCNQAYDTFHQVWKARGDVGLTAHRIFESHSPKIEDETSGICFVGFQKLASQIKGNTELVKTIRKNCRLIVVDEAHKALAPTYLEGIEFLRNNPNVRLMGLTATPGRATGTGSAAIENERFTKFFSDGIFKIRGLDSSSSEIEYLQNNEYLAKLNRIEIRSGVQFTKDEVDSINLDNVDLPPNLLYKLSIDTQRNLKIVNEVKKAVVERKDPTLIFSTSISHAVILQFLLRNEGIEAESVFGSTHPIKRNDVISRFKSGNLMVLINYNVLTTGFDAPNLGTLVISRPTSSVILYSQMVGRALRGPKMGGHSSVNTLIDLVDNSGRFGSEQAAFNYFDEYFLD
jgi:superfamily II DNA or RNA helicase